MWPPSLAIRYVDGSWFRGSVLDWERSRADGVDEVVIGNPRTCSFAGGSVYWLYPEGDTWVAGSGGVGASYGPDNPPPEIVFLSDGRQVARRIRHMPDLLHSQVKLGWWSRDHAHQLHSQIG